MGAILRQCSKWVGFRTAGLLVVLSMVGCEKPLVDPSSKEELSVSSMASGRAGTLPPPTVDRAFQCFTSVRDESGVGPSYRYSTLNLDWPRGLLATAQNRVVWFRYIRWDDNGRVSRVANCVIPDGRGALMLALAKFRDHRLTGGPPRSSLGLGTIGNGATLKTSSSMYESPGDCYYDWGEDLWHCSDGCWYYWDENAPPNGSDLTTQSSTEGDWVIDHCDVDPIEVPGCPTGKTWDEFEERCVCDNGSDEEDCWLPPDDPPGDECDPDFEDCDGDGTGGGGDDPCTSCTNQLSASVMCTPTSLTRGTPVHCSATISPNNSYLYRWQFVSADLKDTVVLSEPQGHWDGTMVTPGEVLVEGRMGVQIATASSFISIIERGWTLGIDIGDGDGPDCGFDKPLHETLIRGWAFSSVCNSLPIEPDLQAGYSVGTGGGPNATIWYVASSNFRVDRHTRVLTDLRPNVGTKYYIAPGSQADTCRAALNIPAGVAVNVNMFDFNTKCVANQQQYLAFYEALWAHENYHKDKAVEAAALPENNIKKLIESLSARSEQDLRNQVQAAHDGAEGRIHAHSVANHGFPAHRYDVWKWNFGGNNYLKDYEDVNHN